MPETSTAACQYCRWRLCACSGACASGHLLTPLAPLAGLLFFSTYTLLVLFWAEIYYQARSLPTGSLRPAFVVMNLAVYAIQVCAAWPPAAAVAVHAANSRTRVAGCPFLEQHGEQGAPAGQRCSSAGSTSQLHAHARPPDLS